MHSVWPSWHPFVPRMVSGSPGNFFFFPPIIKQKLFAFYLGEGRCCSIFTGGNNNEYGNWCFKICSEKKWLLRGVNVDGGCFVLVWFFVWFLFLVQQLCIGLKCATLKCIVLIASFWRMKGVALGCATQMLLEAHERTPERKARFLPCFLFLIYIYW